MTNPQPPGVRQLPTTSTDDAERIEDDAASASPFDARRTSHWLMRLGSPLGISLVLHAMLLLIFAAFTWAVTARSDDADLEFDAKIIAEGPSEGPTGGYRFPGQARTDRPDAPRSPTDDPQESSLASLLKGEDRPVIPHAAGLGSLNEGLGASALSRADIIGTGGGGGALGQSNIGTGLGDHDAAGGGPIGSLWGVGQGQRAKTVVYVVDRSASFIDWVEAIDLELKRSLGVLQREQLFNIIFLRENVPLAFKPRLVEADERNKREAFAWINMYTPAGGSDLIPAVRAGLKYSPHVLFIITDQEFLRSVDQSTNMPELLNVVRAARRRQKTTVNVILMGAFERPTGDAAELRRELAGGQGRLPAKDADALREKISLLETIAAVQKLPAETGGTFSYLNGDALMEQWRKARGGP